MSEQKSNEQQAETSQPKKVSLAEAMRRKLAQDKQNQAKEQNATKLKSGNQTVKSQHTKKPNNQRRKTGG
jgi:hypothetical protein